MQPGEPASHRVQLRLAERFFDAWKYLVFFEPHVVVKKFSNTGQLFRFNRGLRREPLLEIQYGRANFRVVGEDVHDFRVPVQPRVPRIRGQQNFFLFAKMHLPRLVPEADKLLRLSRNRGRALLRQRFRCAPHPQCLNKRKVVVLAKRMQTWMAFHW